MKINKWVLVGGLYAFALLAGFMAKGEKSIGYYPYVEVVRYYA